MGKIELGLKDMIISQYGSLNKFAEKIDMPWTTLDSILKRGVANSNITNVFKITKELGISAEQLLDNNIEHLPSELDTIAAHNSTTGLTQEDLDDVANFIEFIKNRKK